LFEISSLPAFPPTSLKRGCYENIDQTLSLRRWDGDEVDWPPAVICRG